MYQWLTILVGFIFTFLFILPAFNISSFGEELLMDGGLFQRLYPKWFLKLTLRNILKKRNWQMYSILEYANFARKMGFAEQEKVCWQEFHHRGVQRYDIMHALAKDGLSAIHQNLLVILANDEYPQQSYKRLISEWPFSGKFRDWAWQKLKENPDPTYIGYVVSSVDDLRPEAWEILKNLKGNQWALFELVKNCKELRSEAWVLLEPQLAALMVSARNRYESSQSSCKPNSKESWQAILDYLTIKESLCKLWNLEPINEKAWRLATM